MNKAKFSVREHNKEIKIIIADRAVKKKGEGERDRERQNEGVIY